jgi:hypothetical protein
MKRVFWFPLQICLKNESFQEEITELVSYMYTRLHVKYPLFSPDFNQTWILFTHF